MPRKNIPAYVNVPARRTCKKHANTADRTVMYFESPRLPLNLTVHFDLVSPGITLWLERERDVTTWSAPFAFVWCIMCEVVQALIVGPSITFPDFPGTSISNKDGIRTVSIPLDNYFIQGTVPLILVPSTPMLLTMPQRPYIAQRLRDEDDFNDWISKQWGEPDWTGDLNSFSCSVAEWHFIYSCVEETLCINYGPQPPDSYEYDHLRTLPVNPAFVHYMLVGSRTWQRAKA